jgi:hypothetical protein
MARWADDEHTTSREQIKFFGKAEKLIAFSLPLTNNSHY